MHIVVFRFSAMGDVALCLPVLRSILALNPSLKITLVTRKNFSFVFENVERLNIVKADLGGAHKGFLGLYRLSLEIKKTGAIDYICDLHQVIRTHILNTMFFGFKIFKIDKGRAEKKKFIKNKERITLKHTAERYLDVFRNIPIKVPKSLNEINQFGFTNDQKSQKLDDFFSSIKHPKIIGFAPFAKHFTKTWPVDYVEDFLSRMRQDEVTVLLFGGPGEEQKKLELLSAKFANVISIAGSFSMAEELTLMKKLSLMIVMDSSNMHFATLCQIPIVSIWGGTHPDLGYAPIDLNAKILQVELSCRPCSPFGRADCPAEHFKCMKDILPVKLYHLVMESLNDTSLS